MVDKAKAAHDQMLGEARADGKTTISSSKLINWIVVDYFEHFFPMRKKKLCQEHFNSRKCVLEAMKIGDPEEMRRALQEAVRTLGATPQGRKAKKANRGSSDSNKQVLDTERKSEPSNKNELA